MRVIEFENLSGVPTSRNPNIKKRVLLGNSELPFLKGLSVATIQPGEIDPLHQHSDIYEIILVLKGIGEIRVEGSTHNLRVGTCAVIDPEESHSLFNPSTKDDLLVITFGIQKGGKKN